MRTKINKKAQVNAETGLGLNSSNNTERFFDKSGDPHIKIKGNSFFDRLSIYRALLKMRPWKFFSLIIAAYLAVNLVFATIYSIIGLEHLGGMETDAYHEKFWEAFFFSAQTLSTVGYGHLYPTGYMMNLIAAIESLLGLLMFAVATGLMYGRFSRPRSYIHFSNIAVLAPFRDGVALMFRMAPYKKHYLTDVEVKVTVGIRTNDDGVHKNQFFSLKLDLSKANTLTLNWTLVHVIDEDSPFYELSEDEIVHLQPELLVFVKGYDDEYSSTVVARTSYTWKEFRFGAKFKQMYYPSEDRQHTIMDLGKLNDVEEKEYNERLFKKGWRKYLHESRYLWLQSKMKQLQLADISVLELGCFDAKTIDYFPFGFSTYVGYDANWENGLELGKKKWKSHAGVKLVESNSVVDFNPGKQRFDCTIAMETLEHLKLEEVEEYIAKLSLATKQYLFISVPYEKGMPLLLKHLYKSIRRKVDEPYTLKELFYGVKGDLSKVQRVEGGHKGFDHRHLLQLISKYFEIRSVEGLPFRDLPLSLNFSVGIVAVPRHA